ncbi:MAG TPA: glucoamylase family protein [Cyclobacteriaceae bacterium]|nr:beta-glucosidase [Cytophagales bacterium]HMR57623.1 glucoamylase family protein [Cyclobacteriaceae bacterium]HRE68374.1 glucoamylase family protein [Cyclobacteriaceae bacterium]HRF32918.1 glucoamylase family protein [Cyclobacteriaceae bacterium]
MKLQKIKSMCMVGLVLCIAACTSKNTNEVAETETRISDDSLFTLVQYKTFQYFWDGAEPVSGGARERFHSDNIYPQNDKHIITSGGTGFGVMAILVGIERKFITREQGVEHLEKLTTFLEKADRFKGVWPHWMNGETGEVKPFSPNDNGGDLVETAFLVQGLLCVRQYFQEGDEREKALAARIDKLWREVEWDWYQKGGQNVLYWHWSPDKEWKMNFPLEGYNECLITYVLAASSPTHKVPAAAYHEGWARGGKIKNDPAHQQYGYHLDLKHNGAPQFGGPLFWSHYSFLGLDPRKLKDQYADYWQHNVNHTLINYQYCVENPKGFKGYGKDNWGLTASYSVKGYAAHSPNEDLGVISPTAALSSFPYTPEQSRAAMKHFYFELGDKIFGEYGFYDAFSEQDNWYPTRYLAIDQGPAVVMMENYRTGLLWKLFMSCPEVQGGLKELGFSY